MSNIKRKEYIENKITELESDIITSNAKITTLQEDVANGFSQDMVDAGIQKKIDDGTIANLTIEDNSVTPNKTTFFTKSINKYNLNDSSIKDGYYYKYSTLYAASDNYSCYTLTGLVQGDIVRCNKNMRFASTLANNSGGINECFENVTEFEVPANVDTFIITIGKNDKSSVMLTINEPIPDIYVAYDNEGKIDEKYIPNELRELPEKILNISLKQIDGTVESINVLNPNDKDAINNKFISFTAESVSDKYGVTGFIHMNIGDTIYSNKDFVFLVVYSLDKTTKKEGKNNIKTFTATEECYIRCTCWMPLSEYIISFKPYPYVEYGNRIMDKYITVEDFKAFLPKEIYVAVGRTIELYNSQVCIYADKYYFEWKCDIGRNLNRKFSVEGIESQIGEHLLELIIRNKNNEPVWYGQTNLKIVSNILNNNVNVLNIGDSLSTAKPWYQEVRTLSNDKITFVGTRYLSSDTERVLNNEGRSGWNTGHYLSNSTYTFDTNGVDNKNPFWDETNSKFSYNYYKSHYNINPDIIQIFLGTNALAEHSKDYTKNLSAKTIKELVDKIREDDSTIPIYIVNTLYRPSQNGIGNKVTADGYNDTGNKYKLNEDLKIFSLMKGLNELLKDYENLYFIPVALTHDSEYNFGQQELDVNPRNSDFKEIYPLDSVHPQNCGYMQFADIIFSTYCGTIS